MTPTNLLAAGLLRLKVVPFPGGSCEENIDVRNPEV
jgi:hypothetical protein